MNDDQSTARIDATDILPPAPEGDAHAAFGSDREADLPRIRWAGIVWGALFALVATVTLVFAVVPDRRADVRAWLLELDPSTVNPGAAVGYVVLAVGVVLLVTGGIAVARRAATRA